MTAEPCWNGSDNGMQPGRHELRDVLYPRDDSLIQSSPAKLVFYATERHGSGIVLARVSNG
jgi:hypothetical protein